MSRKIFIFQKRNQKKWFITPTANKPAFGELWPKSYSLPLVNIFSERSLDINGFFTFAPSLKK
jgi:hypothetical protein